MKVYLKTYLTELISLANITFGLLMHDLALILQIVLVLVGAVGGLVSMWIKIDNHLFERKKRKHEKTKY